MICIEFTPKHLRCRYDLLYHIRDMIEFYWRVPDSGYEWQKLKPYPRGKSVRVLTEVNHDCKESYRDYPLFQETGLFKTFAGLAIDESSINSFANQYGWLGSHEPLGPESDLNFPVWKAFSSNVSPSELRLWKKLPMHQPNSPLVSGETLPGWCREIVQLRHAIALEEWSQRGQSSYLTEFIRWCHGVPGIGVQISRWIEYRGPGVGEKSPATLTLLDLDAEFADGDLIEPAQEVVRRLINDKLEEHGVLPQLLWDRRSRDHNRRIKVVPKNLIAAIWVQFALAIEGNRQYRQCDQCCKWYEISAEKREGARFCTDACRFKAYRIRQKEARKLHSEGLSLMGIAKKLGSEIEVVKGWIDNERSID